LFGAIYLVVDALLHLYDSLHIYFDERTIFEIGQSLKINKNVLEFLFI